MPPAVVIILGVDANGGLSPVTVPIFVPISSDPILDSFVDSYIIYVSCGLYQGTLMQLVLFMGSLFDGTKLRAQPLSVSFVVLLRVLASRWCCLRARLESAWSVVLLVG